MGPWVHNIDPIIGTIFGVHLWWYGLGYSLGFLNAHVFFLRRRVELGLSRRDVYELSLLLSTGVLVGARLLVVNNEWAFYRDHLALIPAIWLGGMATHGLILGGLAGVVLFCVLRRKPLLRMDYDTGEVFGRLAAQLRKQGRGEEFRIMDLWLAAQAVQREFSLLTFNAKHFKDIPGLKVVVLPQP
mgnify:CR=1 FL=1